MNIDIFKIENNKIGFNTHKIVIHHYTNTEMEKYTDSVHYVDKDGLYEFEVNLVPKHKLLEIVSKEELDTSMYEWMEGIELKTDNRQKEIAEIASYGSLEAYQASLPEYTDEYMLDLDVRLSMIEMGVE